MSDLFLNNWYALYTKSRHEKLIESELSRLGIEVFTPTITIKKRWSDRTKHIEQPLFKSYCFAKFPLQEKRRVLSQKGVVNIVHFKDNYIPVDEQVINSIKILLNTDLKIDPCPYYKIGDKVRIKQGYLKGCEGYIKEKRQNNTTLVISVDAIAASLQCVVDVNSIDLI